MIFTLSIIINLCLIFAVSGLLIIVRNESYRLHKKCDDNFIRIYRKHPAPKIDYEVLYDKIGGKLDKMYTRAVIAEKMAERAFNMASSSNLGVVALQKALALPRLMTKPQVKQNELAKNSVDKIFSSDGKFDWLRPILSEEDLDILDKAEEEFRTKDQ